MQGNDVQNGGVQRMTVFPLGELRPRPSWCAGGLCEMNIGGRRGKRSGRYGPNTGRPQSSRRRKCKYGVANQNEKPRSEDSGRTWRARRRCGAVRSRKGSSCTSRGVRSAMLWHRMCMGRRSSTREQEIPRVRGEVGITNPFGSVVSSHDPRHPTVLTLVDHSTAIITRHHEDHSFGHLPPTATSLGKLLRHPRSLVIIELFSSPILSPRDFTFRLFFSTTKATPRFALIH
jgi:hypothetical protein